MALPISIIRNLLAHIFSLAPPIIDCLTALLEWVKEVLSRVIKGIWACAVCIHFWVPIPSGTRRSGMWVTCIRLNIITSCSTNTGIVRIVPYASRIFCFCALLFGRFAAAMVKTIIHVSTMNWFTCWHSARLVCWSGGDCVCSTIRCCTYILGLTIYCVVVNHYTTFFWAVEEVIGRMIKPPVRIVMIVTTPEKIWKFE